MKVVVLVKQTFATEARIELDERGEIASSRVKKVVNPYDEFAVEEAILMVERKQAEKSTVLSLGSADTQEGLRQCLAMGADEAVYIDGSGWEGTDSSIAAKLLAAALKKIGFDLILSGYVAVDDNAAQVPLRVAEILGIPHVNVVSRLEIEGASLKAWREADGRTEVLSAQLPCLVTADKSLNKPRYPTLPNIMKAKKKPLMTFTPADLGLEPQSPGSRVVKYFLPPPRAGARRLEGSPAEAAVALVSALRDEAKVI